MVKINMIAKNFDYGTEDTEHEKILLTRISDALKPNQWIHISKNPKLTIDNFKNFSPNKQVKYFKPEGLWMSKGEWLFHDFSEIIYNTNKKPV